MLRHNKYDVQQQACAKRLVDQHVYTCQSSLVDELLRNDVFRSPAFSWDDVENLRQPRDEADLRYSFPDEAQTYERGLKFINLVIDDDEDPFRVYLTRVVGGIDLDLAGAPEDESLDDEFSDEFEEFRRIQEEMSDWWDMNEDHSLARFLVDVYGVDEGEVFEYAEVYEWWVVSPWLLYELKERGEVILNNEYGTWWGRCTTGQSIALDGVINEIAREHHDMFVHPGDPVDENPPDVGDVLRGWRGGDIPLRYRVGAVVYAKSYRWAYEHSAGRNAVPQPYFSDLDGLPTLVWGWRDLSTGQFYSAFCHEDSCEVCGHAKPE